LSAYSFSIYAAHGATQSAAIFSDVHLQFDQQKTFKVIVQGAPLHASVYVQFQSIRQSQLTGQVGVIWQVARLDQPLLDIAALTYQTIGELQLVRSSKSLLFSPSLPTDALGLYVVQLSVSGGDVYYLHYQVVKDLKQSILAPASIELLSPAPRQAVVFDAPIPFLWLHDAPVAAYRYELYAASAAHDFAHLSLPPSHASILVGQLVAAQQTQWQFDSALIKNMPRRPGRYFWRVVGLGLDGATVSRSQLQMITLQF
jgi:hypothetical protein